jgi:NADH dehydrogenase
VKHIVIVGGGFAGLSCARNLASHPDVRITLMDKNNYQQFQPLFYQVAGSMVASENVAFPLREVFLRNANVDVKLATVISADLKTRTLKTAEGEVYTCDFLVLAVGSQVNFFGVPGAGKYACPLYSLRDAEQIRSHVLTQFESADRDPSVIAQGALDFVIVGAGPTGTEMAGTLADMLQQDLVRQYKDLSLNRARIFLIDVTRSVLGGFSARSRMYAERILKQRGVRVLLGAAVNEVGADYVRLSDASSSRIPTRTVIWAGGLQASLLSKQLGLQPGRGGRIDVQSDLSVAGFPGVYALGDFANITGPNGQALPQLAAVAKQSGVWCAKTSWPPSTARRGRLSTISTGESWR